MTKYYVAPQSGGFISGLSQGISTGAQLYNLHRGMKDDEEKEARKAALQAAGSTTPTEVVGRNAAMEGLDQAFLQAQQAGMTPEQEASYAEARTALQSRPETATYEFGGRTQSRPFTPVQVDAGRLSSQADVLAQHGDPLGATRLRTAGSEYEAAEQKRADDSELRGVMSRGLTIGAASSNPSPQPGQPVTQGPGNATATPAGDAPGRSDLDLYLKRIAPKTMETLVKQGRYGEAKQFREFVDSEAGRSYATLWAAGMRKHAIGDTEGAVRDFMGLYNDQAYADGGTVKLTPVEQGQFRADFFDQDGKPTGSQTGALDQFSGQAAMALSPEKAVKFYAEQSAASQKQAWQDQRDDARDDRRDDRLVKRFQHERDMLGRRQANSGGLTATQQRSNVEIDAAREMVAGLSQDEIRRRTAKATDSGRENASYDPGLARAANLAGRRKVGEDEYFDSRQGRSAQPKPAAAGQDAERGEILQRFQTDGSMRRYRAGKHTPQGVEVLDSSGRIVGHYR